MNVSFAVKTVALTLFILTSVVCRQAVAQPAMKVLVAPVIRAPLVEKLPLSGTLVSPKFSALATRIDGYVEKLFVDVGDKVQKGDPLLSLDAKIAKLELQRLKAAREEAEVLYRDAERLAVEARKLVGNQHISQTEYETRLAQAAARNAAVIQLDAQLAIQQEQFDRHTLRAPFEGVIAEKLTETGAWVNNDSAVLRLVQMDPLYLQARVSERYFGRLQKGGQVAFYSGLRSEQSRVAQVDRVVPVSDPSSRTFLIRAVIPNLDGSLVPGMSIKAEFTLSDKQADAVLQVPADAIVRRIDGDTIVWVIRPVEQGKGEQGKVAQPVMVSVGRSESNRVEIRSDQLKPGDSVIVLGNESLRPGQSVSIETAG